MQGHKMDEHQRGSAVR